MAIEAQYHHGATPLSKPTGAYHDPVTGNVTMAFGDVPKYHVFTVPCATTLAIAIHSARHKLMREGRNNYATGWTTGDVDFY